MSCQEEFFKQLRSRGFRLTPQREIILAVLHDVESFATAEEIYQRVREISTSIDISTVYRTLELLQQFGLVAGVELDDGQKRFELVGLHGPHCHLVCRSCHKLIGVSADEMASLLEALQVNHAFSIDLSAITLSGVCQDCLSASEAAGADVDEESLADPAHSVA